MAAMANVKTWTLFFSCFMADTFAIPEPILVKRKLSSTSSQLINVNYFVIKMFVIGSEERAYRHNIDMSEDPK